MAKESLDSDRVNYLIWRYLVEADYRETAVKLQKEWNLANPQELPFAAHVTAHALVSVLNKGLLYNVAEREDARVSNAEATGSIAGVFGPVAALSPILEADPIGAEEDVANARKRQIEHVQLPPKRQRLSNGFENGLDTVPAASAMQLDNEHAYPSPVQAPSPLHLTNGPEQGTQIDIVADLTPTTIFLDLTDDDPARASTLLQCAWHPRDPMILAASGTDALAKVWSFETPATESIQVSRDLAPLPDTPNGYPQSGSQEARMTSALAKPQRMPSQLNLLHDQIKTNTTCTAMTWASDGSSLLVANEPLDETRGKIDVYNPGGLRMMSLDGFESPIFHMRWNFSNTVVLILSPFKGTSGAAVAMIVAGTQQLLHLPLPQHDLGEQPLEVVWTGDEDFILCGGIMLHAYHAGPDGITLVRKYEVRDDHAMSKIAFDGQFQLLATASDLGRIDLWDKQGLCQSFDAHQGVITALAWRPIPMQMPKPTDGRDPHLLASAGEDGAISLWDEWTPVSKPRASMTMRSAVLAIAFTPTGDFIAGATNEEVLIWNVDDVTMPRARWHRDADLGWQTPMSRDSTPEEDHYCLSWNSNGTKLAYGVNNLLAVIDFSNR